MKKKVLCYAQDGVGGAERMTAFIGRHLDPEEYEICFCLIRRRSKSSITDFIPSEIRKIWLSNKSLLDLMFGLVKSLVKEKPDIVFSSVFNLNNKLLLLKVFMPTIRFIIRCDNYMYAYTEKQQKILKWLYPKADVIIAQTEEMEQELIEYARISKRKINVLHNPVDKQLIDSKMYGAANPYPANGRKHYVAVGRFNPQKGFVLLIEAFIKVAAKRDDVDLYYVGDTSTDNGGVAASVRHKAENAGVSERVFFCGYKDNPFPYMRYADCFVLSSIWEGLPNVLIEALYLGTPVAAFKCIPIIERIIKEGVDGYLAEKEDTEALAEAMIKAIKMGRVCSSYQSANISEFTKLFKMTC